jgi:hypothetical protein
MLRGTATGRRVKESQPVRHRVSFAESDEVQLETPAAKENSPPTSDADRRKPQASLSSKFSQRWDHKAHKPDAPVDVFDDGSADPGDIVAEKPGPPRREKASQTAESILRDIDLMVARVREICSKRPK